MITQTLPWIPPLKAAEALTRNEHCWALLYSGQRHEHTGRHSYLALYPQETITGGFMALAAKLGDGDEALCNAWFGYLGYELLHETERLRREDAAYIRLPDLWFTRFGLVVRFDHAAQEITCFREPHIALPSFTATAPTPPFPEVRRLSSPMARQAYLDLVAMTQAAIARGDFYQANITRKFTGEFMAKADALSVFKALSIASPAAYSACIRMGDAAIISSSPERFLTLDASGHMETRPIKGTAPRSADPAQLAASAKDRAENLMIVDLMRNDLARAARPGSVCVERLFEVSSYATLHHMASTISAQKRADIPTLEAVKSCFPPGSMTGAPKFRALQWCLTHEGIRRGVYSGALGWFGGDGSCDLSVVIRTLVTEGNRFEFQVGGGIVADSDPESEWRETMTKAHGICKALGVNAETLEKL